MTRLATLIDDSLALAPEYRAGLTNHLPMALHALASLGADDTRLAAFRDAYAGRFAAPTTPDGWAAARDHYAARIEAQGFDATLREALPALWPGVAAAAFHGPIRAAHAAELGHAGELAAALAYWRVRAQPLPEPEGPRGTLAFDDWAAAIEAAALEFRSRAPLISGRIAQASALPAYHALGNALAVPADGLIRFARWAAGLYAQTGNFTVLHLVTGARAVRVLLRWTDDLDAALATLWPALAAAVIGSELRPRGAVPSSRAGWDEVRPAAIASNDDHVVKLVHACIEHAAIDPRHDAYLLAARRAVG